ncbi:MAG: hypothetical protein R2702_18550 [Acidimicrobiales bacterium]
MLDALPLGAPTSVGSLPHVDRARAIGFVLDRTPELPAAPTVPRLDPLEMMVPQGLWGVPGVEVGRDGSCSVPDPGALDPSAPLGDPELAGAPFATWRAFLEAVAGRAEPVKLQLTGPVTLGMVLVDAGVPAAIAFDVTAGGRARARHLLALAERSAPGTPLLVVLDEPGLVGGLRPDLPLPGDRGPTCLGALAALEQGAATGVHVCGPADWRLVLQAGPGVLSVPVGADATGSAVAIGSFLERGGRIAWGRCPPTGSSASSRRASGASCRPSGASWCRTAATWCCCAARRS